MTIEEAIKHCEEVYRENPATACGAEHRQLAEWLGDMKRISLTTDEAYAMADFIDSFLYDRIRADTEIDSMEWLLNIVHAYEKLCRFSGYRGMTESQ